VPTAARVHSVTAILLCCQNEAARLKGNKAKRIASECHRLGAFGSEPENADSAGAIARHDNTRGVVQGEICNPGCKCQALNIAALRVLKRLYCFDAL
jgi:hypothetical protein